jgi:hypothetical protein
MPDLTTEYAWSCATNREWSKTIAGSRGATYTLRFERDYRPSRTTEHRYTCTCKGFQHRGDCKHVKAAYAVDLGGVKGPDDRCGWNGRFELPEVAEDASGEHSCPMCQGPVFSFAYGA